MKAHATRVVFFAPPGLTSLDLIGPLQAFQVAQPLGGHAYRVEVCTLTESLQVAGNLRFSNLLSYDQIALGPDDVLFVAGCEVELLQTPEFLREQRPLFEWIRRTWQSGTTISIG